jgi:hypothetical protein
MAGPLSVGQLSAFKRDGLLVLPELVDAPTLEGWRAQFAAHTELLRRDHADDPGTWPTHPTDFPRFFLEPQAGRRGRPAVITPHVPTLAYTGNRYGQVRMTSSHTW